MRWWPGNIAALKLGMDGMTSDADGPGSGTVARAVHFMRYFASHPEVTIKELSAAMKVTPSTCHRLLLLLASEGIVTHVKARRTYEIGPEYCRMAAQVQSHNPFPKIIQEKLKEMVIDYDETCIFSSYIPAKRKMVFSEKVESSRPLRYQLLLNEPMTVFWGATGRVIFANLPAAEREAIYNQETVAPASGEPLPGRVELQAELDRIVAQGYSITIGQKTPGSVGIAGPVYNAENLVIGSVGFTIPQSQISRYDLAELGHYVARKAEEISAMLGAIRPPAAAS